MLGKERKISREDLRNVAPLVGIGLTYLAWLTGRLPWKPTVIVELTLGCGGVIDQCRRTMREDRPKREI